jgi:hypothetical protein
LAILGTLRNSLDDQWHIADGTEKPAEICWLWHIGQSQQSGGVESKWLILSRSREFGYDF